MRPFLPHYNRTTVDAIIADLKNVEDVPPATTGVGRDLITLARCADAAPIFAAMQKLVTYRVNKVRVQSSLRRQRRREPQRRPDRRYDRARLAQPGLAGGAGL